MSHRRSISLTDLLTHHAYDGDAKQSLLLFRQLPGHQEKVSRHALVAILKACGRLRASAQGKSVHSLALKLGLSVDVALMTSLLDMYSKCNQPQDAQFVYGEMRYRDAIATNGMISALFRCNRVFEAISLFNDTPEKDVDTWNSLISGLVQTSNSWKALLFFKHMAVQGVSGDSITFASILSACAEIAAKSSGKQIHGTVTKHGLQSCLPVANAIIDMYAKVGSIEDMRSHFAGMPVRNVVSWTSLIVGYGKHGLGTEAMDAFKQMVSTGVIPNKVTFMGTLSACSHAGLLHEGWRNFRSMVDIYHIMPEIEHYGCMVDLLARSGKIDEAWKFINNMPIKPDCELWTALLSSCYFHRNTEISRLAADRLLELEPRDAGAYTLISNFYSYIGELERVADVRKLMRNRAIIKKKAQTWIEINGTVHSFESGDKSHPSHKYIARYLERLLERIREVGYVPNTDVVVQDGDGVVKEDIVLGHSEKMAIAFGLMSTPPGTSITIVKNLRVCEDRHVAIALISKVEGREITARDSSRFHKFQNGKCTCKNYW